MRHDFRSDDDVHGEEKTSVANPTVQLAAERCPSFPQYVSLDGTCFHVFWLAGRIAALAFRAAHLCVSLCTRMELSLSVTDKQ